MFASQGLVGRWGKKVFNSLESGNFGEGRRARLRVIAFLTAIRQIMIYLRDRYGLDQDGCVFVAADHVGLGDPLYPQKEQARRINSTAWGRLKKCETDSLIGKVARTVKSEKLSLGRKIQFWRCLRHKSEESRVSPVNRKLKHNGASLPSSSGGGQICLLLRVLDRSQTKKAIMPAYK